MPPAVTGMDGCSSMSGTLCISRLSEFCRQASKLYELEAGAGASALPARRSAAVFDRDVPLGQEIVPCHGTLQPQVT